MFQAPGLVSQARVEPLFYRVRRGFHDNLARFFRTKIFLLVFFF